MTYGTLKIEKRENGAAWLWLNRPDAHNSMSEQMLIDIPQAVAELEADTDVRASYTSKKALRIGGLIRGR